MSTPALEWTDSGFSTDGRFAIHSEQVRGEPRFYWLVCHREADGAMYRALDLGGAYDKRTVRRQAERIVREVDQ